MRKNFVILAMALLLTACSKEEGKQTDGQNAATPTTALDTQAPTAEPEPEESYTPAEPFDQEGRAVAVYGTPTIDGTIDPVWDATGTIVPTQVSSTSVQASGEFRLLWDDTALYTLYVIKDPDLNKANTNTYEQDSVEVFLDELNDKTSSYQNDDVHYRVNFDNFRSYDAGDSKRFFTATSELKDDTGNKIGYTVESSLTWSNPPANNQVMGFELQINDADSSAKRLGTINIFDKTGTAWSTPSSMGEIILTDKASGTTIKAKTNPYMLTAYVKHLEAFNPKGYANFDILTKPMETARAILQNPEATQEEIDAILNKLRELEKQLNDGSGFVSVSELKENIEITDPFTFFNGDKVTSKEDWSKRAEELSKMYQYFMYGVMPDPSLEKVSYGISGKTMNITVEKDDKKITFPVEFNIPDKEKVTAPEGGYPVIMAFGWLTQVPYANENGYATITLNTQLIAADDYSKKGVFYELYPYGDIWTEQTGTLMAWSWGISKIIDALEAGAGAELGISPTHTIVTGVSRWGKAAAVAGAFDKRIKVTAPSCSGAGGMAMFRYPTQGKVYDYSSIGASSTYTMTQNEPLSSLQSSSERHWFNDNFLNFKDVNYLPFDQHLLAALTAEEGRYLFITGSYLYEDWTNPPAMWLTYLAAKEVFDYLDLPDNIAIHIHKEGHMVTDQDMVYLIDYCNYHFYGKQGNSNLNDLKTSLYAEEANYDPIFDNYMK